MTQALEGIDRIALLAPLGLGDFVFAQPALQALERAYPQAELTLLGARWMVEFLRGRPGPVRRAVVLPHARGLHAPAAQQPDATVLDAFFAEMRQARFDLALQLYGGGLHSNAFLLRLGARFTAGRRTPDAPALDRWLPFGHYQNEVLRHLETVALVGARADYRPPRVALVAADAEALAQSCRMPEQAYTVLHPGAGDARRRWPGEKFAAVAQALHGRGLAVVMTGCPAERTLLEQVAAALAPPPLLCDRLSTAALAALLRGARVVVANDTGPAHLARAVGTPTVTVYWGPNAINAGPLHQARDRAALSWQMRCPVCGHDYGDPYPYRGRPCAHAVSLVDAVPVEEVTEAALDLLDRG